MIPVPITDGTGQPITAAGVAAPATGLSIATLAAPYALSVNITNLTAASGAPAARIVIEDTVDAFTTAQPVAVFNVGGPITQNAPVALSLVGREIPSMRIGVANAKLRARVAMLDGTTPSLTFAAFLQN